jgi:hypothetical protein
MTLGELGAKIKQKYPQYQNVPDEELAKQIIEKYPVYKQYITETPTTTQTTASAAQQYRPKGVLEKVTGGATKAGKFLGMKPFGKGIALTLMRIPGLRRVIAPEVAKLEEKISKGSATPEELKAYSEIFGGPEVGGMAPTGRQIIGSALQTGLLATAPAVPTGTTLGSRVGIGAGIGAVSGLARGLEAEKELTPTELAKTTTIGGAVGAVTSAILYGIEKGLQKLGQRLYQSIVRYNRDPEGASETLVKDRIIGTASQLKDKIDKKINIYEKALQTYLKNTQQKVTQERIIQEALNQAKLMTRPELQELFNEEAFRGNIQSGLEKLGLDLGKKELTLAQVNALRREIDRKLGDRAFQKAFEELPTTKEALMALRKGLENIVKTEIPETSALFAEYAPYVETSKALAQTIYQASKRMPITFFELAGIGGGVIYPKALPTIIGTLATRRGIESGLLPSLIGATSLRVADFTKLLQTPEGLALLLTAISRLYPKSPAKQEQTISPEEIQKRAIEWMQGQ